ncbi:MAG: hypothetical protein ABIG11_04525 [bacterium]
MRMSKFPDIKIILFAGIILACFSAAGLCKENKPAAIDPKAVKAAAQTALSTVTVTVEQFYRTENLRDPFVPATGIGGERIRVQQTAAQQTQFNIHDLILTGIMEDSRGKQAIFSNPNSGLGYVLSGGRLTDIKRKPVEGVRGIIQGKQVILSTPEEDIQPFTLHEKQEK